MWARTAELRQLDEIKRLRRELEAERKAKRTQAAPGLTVEEMERVTIAMDRVTAAMNRITIALNGQQHQQPPDSGSTWVA